MNSNTAEQLDDETIETEATTEPKGLVEAAFNRLIERVLVPNVERAKTDVARTEEEHDRAIEYASANPSDSNQKAVASTKIAALTAPAILVRAESVLREARKLRDSDACKEADRALVDSEGSRTVFMGRLDKHLVEVQSAAGELANALLRLDAARDEHHRVNGEGKLMVKGLHTKLAALNEKCDLTHELGKRTLDIFDSRSLVLAAATSIKTVLRAKLGADRSRHLIDCLDIVQSKVATR